MSETGQDPGWTDPPLTADGHAQAREAVAALAPAPIKRIIASPYRRALQTATPIAQHLGLTIEVHVGVREHKAYSCDVGSPTTEIAREWPHLDFSHIPEIWWPVENEATPMVRKRAAQFRAEMEGPGWDHTLVISHWGFLLSLTGESFENGEWRRIRY